MVRAADRFEAFSGQHLLILALFAVGAVGFVLLGRSQRRSSDRPGQVATGRSAPGLRSSRVLAVVVACFTLPGQVLQLLPGSFDVGSSLPLQLCDLASLATVWALWTHRPLPVALTYFWGLSLTSQAVVTPSLDRLFPDPGFFVFWGMHLLVVWAALYLSLGLGLGPRWRDYRATVLVTLGWAVLVLAIDVAFDLNYGYLRRKPPAGSLFDPLGPWPVYVLAAMGLLLAGWALLTWPWALADRRADRRAGRRTGPTFRRRSAG